MRLCVSILDLHWIKEDSADSLYINLDPRIYSLETIFRSCYLFTDRCYIFISNDEASILKIYFSKKVKDCNLQNIIGEFSNELINQQVRLQIASETKIIRELIVAQAFAEADLLDRSLIEASYIEDPKDISK